MSMPLRDSDCIFAECPSLHKKHVMGTCNRESCFCLVSLVVSLVYFMIICCRRKQAERVCICPNNVLLGEVPSLDRPEARSQIHVEHNMTQPQHKLQWILSEAEHVMGFQACLSVVGSTCLAERC